MKVQILFLRNRSLLSRLIKFVTQGEHCHVAIVLNHYTVLQTDFIHNLNLSYLSYKKCDYDLVTLNLKPIQEIEVGEWTQTHLYTPYDNFENWRYLMGYKKSNNQSKLNCVEATINLLCDISYLNQVYLDMNLSPSELYEILKSKSSY